jgi:hypothetical protein
MARPEFSLKRFRLRENPGAANTQEYRPENHCEKNSSARWNTGDTRNDLTPGHELLDRSAKFGF